jgi:predicted Fe-Mo cluster-binding NifX family protein
MKVAITAVKPSLESAIDPRFGRCAYFVIVETDDMSFEAIKNANQALDGGAGIQSANTVAKKGIKAVLTGNCGPNAYQTLNAAGIAVIVGLNGTIREVLQRFIAGEFRPAQAPNVRGHSGLGSGSAAR